MAKPIFPIIVILLSTSVLPQFVLCAASDGNGWDEEATHYHYVPIDSLLPASACSHSNKGETEGVSSLTITQGHGPCSPQNAKAPTISEMFSHNKARIKSIQSRYKGNSANNSKRDSKSTVPAIGVVKDFSAVPGYLITIELGTPPRKLSLLFDTGSSNTWTQCKPCTGHCYKQDEPIFDPSKSKTYKSIGCHTTKCIQIWKEQGSAPSCFGNSPCPFGVVYGDQGYSMGNLATDTLRLTKDDIFPNHVFGCGQNSSDDNVPVTAGLLGLGREVVSFPFQTLSKYRGYFSYCLPSSSSKTGYLTFGKSKGFSSMKFTPMLTGPEGGIFFAVDITGIKVGRHKLPIPKAVFRKAGAIVDSGTTITMLPPAAYAILQKEFRKYMVKYPRVSKKNEENETCYDLRNYTTVRVPKISMYFGGNIEVPIDKSGILFPGDFKGEFCLAFMGNSDPTDLAIFGNVQQRTYEVGYDNAGKKIGFRSGGCS